MELEELFSLQRGVCRFQIMVLVKNSAHNAHQFETFKEERSIFVSTEKEQGLQLFASDVNVSAERLKLS